ncbi:HAD-IA family hydrolase [Methylophilus sp. 13]|jgi:N-acetyl-D-muramate 6-phosphate phosphatase|uniref:HAD family hydrolase n=1 Tax=Methylophilus sp. 13 TaxID=2781018 RepID=UPI00188FBAF8|nr:HAD-IA family hydrolase [Methylophilus sp. 13]MBF5038809.1 HAD-IA family hydrolase [Methylophilus sp. 13]
MQAVLFDLDGTLVDTAPDLAYALNLQRERHGLPFLPEATIRPYASHGSRGLLEVGFGLLPDHAEFEQMRTEYLELYTKVMTRQPQLFDGMAEVLQEIEQRGLRWGIVTNKPRRFTLPMITHMALDSRAGAVISGDDAPQPKPAPQTLLLACERMQLDPEQVVYVGDAERDVQAGNAAGMTTLVALFGYLSDMDRPEAWGADGCIQQPQDLLAYL